MVADRPLREPERLDEVADAGLAVGLGLDEAEEPQPGRVGEHLQDLCELVGFPWCEGALEERRAADGDRYDGLHLVNHIDDGRWLGQDRIDGDQYREEGAMNVLDPVTQHHVRLAAEALTDEFAGVYSQKTIERFIAESLDLLGDARINVFVPVLAHRFARERLKALGQAEGRIAKQVPEVLFVCVQNAGRSQMAAGLLSYRAQDKVHVRSAGSDPAERINPAVVEAMAELGIDLDEEFPKPLTDEVVRAADAVITMGCGDACPIYPGKRYLDWVLDDPAGKDLEAVRKIRDEIDARVQALLAELVVDDG